MGNIQNKEQYFTRPRIDVVGSNEKPNGYIYQLDENGIMFRDATFDTGKGGNPVEILHTTDFHLNFLNMQDVVERLPCVMSTREARVAFHDGWSIPNTNRTMALAKWFDLTVVTGDTMDYLTWGSLELMDELVWSADENVMVAVGGHDITRVMQGTVPDDTTLESRYEILKKNWRHDIHYQSKVLEDKVKVIVLNNGEGRYFSFQGERLLEDIAAARAAGQIILIFQHEPLCTYNDSERNVEHVRTNDGCGSHNFCEHFMCKPGSDDESMEVYRIITENADVIKGVFCGHRHSDIYTEIIAAYPGADGAKHDTVIPQYILTGNMYDKGHVFRIIVK